MNRSLVGGALLIVLGLATLTGGRYLLAAEQRQVQSAAPYDATRPVGTRVRVAGTVAAANPILVHAFVDGVRERRSEGTGTQKASWSVVQAFHQDLLLEAAGATLVIANSAPCTRGDSVKTIEEPGSIRVRGIERGAPLIAVGTLVSLTPPTIHAELTYADTESGYMADFQVVARYLYITVAILAAVGIALVARGARKR